MDHTILVPGLQPWNALPGGSCLAFQFRRQSLLAVCSEAGASEQVKLLIQTFGGSVPVIQSAGCATKAEKSPAEVPSPPANTNTTSTSPPPGERVRVRVRGNCAGRLHSFNSIISRSSPLIRPSATFSPDLGGEGTVASCTERNQTCPNVRSFQF